MKSLVEFLFVPYTKGLKKLSMDMQPQAIITGLGKYIPEKVLTNADLEKMVETSHEWIFSRSGIEERRIASDNEPNSFMGSEAAKNAIASAGILPDSIDAIIVCTMTPDYLCPSTGAIIQHNIEAKRAFAFDISAACSGFLYGLAIAKGWVQSGLYTTVLVVATEKNSTFLDFKDRSTCVLFGDGAGAAVVQNKGSGYAIGHICLGTDGSAQDLIIIPASGSRIPASHETVDARLHFMKMKGKEVFRHAVRRMESACEECLKKSGLSAEAVTWLIPHQANIRIMETIAKRFDIPWERVFKTIQKYGNTSSSSIPIALEELEEEHIPPAGSHILLTAFGGGLTWGATLLEKVEV
jgi:3-oxoacyl-[acyl-carrier-protein] synthase III